MDPSESSLSHVKPKIRDILDAETKECLVTVQRWDTREQVIAVREGKEQ